MNCFIIYELFTFYKIRNTDSINSSVPSKSTIQYYSKTNFNKGYGWKMSWNESHTEKALILSQARDSCSTKYYTFRIWSNLFYCMVFIIAHSISTALISISFIIFFSFIAHSEFLYTSFTIFILAVCKWRVNRTT